jgi:hypothetical protein
MSAPLRSHASVRSYYFRQHCADNARILARYRLSDFRCAWRTANAKAFEWRRRATTLWNHETKQWEPRP